MSAAWLRLGRIERYVLVQQSRYLAIALGVIAAWKANSWIDRAIMGFAVLGFSVPVFVIAAAGLIAGTVPTIGTCSTSRTMPRAIVEAVLQAMVIRRG